MAKATTIKEAIKRFEEAQSAAEGKEVVAAEQEKVTLWLNVARAQRRSQYVCTIFVDMTADTHERDRLPAAGRAVGTSAADRKDGCDSVNAQGMRVCPPITFYLAPLSCVQPGPRKDLANRDSLWLATRGPTEQRRRFKCCCIASQSKALAPPCRHLALSTNNIEKISSLTGMENLRILSLGRNCIKKIENLEGVADTLEQLWISYNQIEKLVGIDKLTNLKVLYLANNKVKDWSEIDRLSALDKLEDLLLRACPIYDEHAATLSTYRVEVRVPRRARAVERDARTWLAVQGVTTVLRKRPCSLDGACSVCGFRRGAMWQDVLKPHTEQAPTRARPFAKHTRHTERSSGSKHRNRVPRASTGVHERRCHCACRASQGAACRC